MEALCWTHNDKLELLDIEEPQITTPLEVKIQIAITGICGTDLAVAAGKEKGVYGVIRGHEAVGTVVEVGSQVKRVCVGDRVVIDPNKSCGQCRFCCRDQPHLCMSVNGQGMEISGLNAHGTFAPYFVTEERFVHRIPDGMLWETAVLIEPLACVLHNFREAQVRQDDAVLVLGSGPMGILCQVVSKRTAAFTAATEVNEYRLAAARTLSDAAIHPKQLNESVVSTWLGDRKFDVIIDTVGNQMETAEQWIDRGGRIVPFGIDASYSHTFSPTKYIQKGIKVIGAGEYRHMFSEAVQLANALPWLSKLVTKRYKLSEHEAAIRELLSSGIRDSGKPCAETLKTVFVP